MGGGESCKSLLVQLKLVSACSIVSILDTAQPATGRSPVPGHETQVQTNKFFEVSLSTHSDMFPVSVLYIICNVLLSSTLWQFKSGSLGWKGVNWFFSQFEKDHELKKLGMLIVNVCAL